MRKWAGSRDRKLESIGRKVDAFVFFYDSEGMSTRRIFESPLTVYAACGVLVGLWGGVFGSSVPARADELDTEVTVETDAEGTTGAPGEDATTTVSGEIPRLVTPSRREGPRLLSAPTEELPGFDIAIEDRDGQSMAALHAALRRAEAGEGQARLVFYGASHVASDLISGHVREELQTRFGDAGHGIIVPAHPWRSYRHRGVELESNRARWHSEKVRGNTSEVDYYGVAGTYVESSRPGAWGRVSTRRSGIGQRAGLFDLYYLQHPQGGSLDILIDGQQVERISTRSTETSGGYATFEVEDGPHSFEVRTVGDGLVRLFGVALERETPGVIVDTLGINGARARNHLYWEDSLYREHLRRRDPDLVVLAYGTNESGDSLPIETYEQQLEQVVGRVREEAPGASCLLIGPSDRPIRDDNTFLDRPRTAELIESQHRVALRHGCGFFDLVALTGGPLSMVEWVNMDPSFGAGDYVHYTPRGYQRVGEVLLTAMMEGYE